MSIKTISVVIIVGVVALVLAWAFWLKGDTPAEDATDTNQEETIAGAENSSIIIRMTSRGFEPSEATIKKGDSVVWMNADDEDRWPASDTHPTHTIYPGFDPQQPIAEGESWIFVFDRVGTWGFHEHLNPSLGGTITVTD
ncbi:MAG: hypothetical protein WD850_00750 [Candidatus Spechtbacterales bacterium]